MIRFSLNCDHDHAFEGWFRNNDDFDMQSERSLVECPVCGSAKVGKALMAPAVSTGRAKDARKQKPQPQPPLATGSSGGTRSRSPPGLR